MAHDAKPGVNRHVERKPCRHWCGRDAIPESGQCQPCIDKNPRGYRTHRESPSSTAECKTQVEADELLDRMVFARGFDLRMKTTRQDKGKFVQRLECTCNDPPEGAKPERPPTRFEQLLEETKADTARKNDGRRGHVKGTGSLYNRPSTHFGCKFRVNRETNEDGTVVLKFFNHSTSAEHCKACSTAALGGDIEQRTAPELVIWIEALFRTDTPVHVVAAYLSGDKPTGPILAERPRPPGAMLGPNGAWKPNGESLRWNPSLKRIRYNLLPTTYYLLPTTYYLLPTTYYLLPTTYYLLHTPYYLLHEVHRNPCAPVPSPGSR
jgi:hypothetical protein